LDREPDPFLGETVGGKRRESSHADAGIEAGLSVLAEVAPLPAAVIGGVVLGVSLLSFLAWKHFSGKPADR
jgi:hypothetical protein